MKVRTIKQNELSPEVRDAARRAMAGCPHGNTARRKCVHCDVEDSERALAAADRLADEIDRLIEAWNIEEEHSTTPHAVHACPFCSTIEARAAYLAERGR